MGSLIDKHHGIARATGSLRETRVGDVMHSGVPTCPPDAPLSDVARTMAASRVHCVIVTVDEQAEESLWGVVSDLDLVAAATVRDVEEQTAAGTSASPILLIGPDDTLLRAAQMMTEYATAHLVVVDPGSGRPLGVLSTLDVARALGAPS